MLRRLFDKGQRPNKMDADKEMTSKLLSAKRAGNIEEIVETLSLQDKEQALIVAAEAGFLEVVIYLVDQGFIFHNADSCQKNMLHILFSSFRFLNEPSLLQYVVKIVNNGVDINQLNEHKETPIVIAAEKGLYDVVRYLLEQGAHVPYDNSYQDNFLHTLFYYYDRSFTFGRSDLLQSVVKLVATGVDVNQLNKDKVTPIVIAAWKGLYDVVMYMLEHGGDVYYVDSHQRNLLHILLSHFNDRYDNRNDLLRCVIKLVDAGVDVNQLRDERREPVTMIATVDFNKSVRKGTPIVADVDVSKNVHKGTPIVAAAKKGLYEVLVYLLEHGGDLHCVDIFKRNILQNVLGCMYSNMKDDEMYLQLVTTLVKTGSNVNLPDYKGNTPLFHVGVNDPCFDKTTTPSHKSLRLTLQTGQDIYVRLKCKLINRLLETDCNVNHQNNQRQTALMYYIKHHADISILKLLITHSDLSLTDINGDTAFSYCVQYNMVNSTAIFKLLVDSGPDLMSRNHRVKLFHDILKCKRLEMFNYCLRLKLFVIGVTAEGENILHLLAGLNYDYSVKKFKWLLNNELDINHPCSKTNTPTMIAAFLLNGKYLELLTHHPRLDINAQNNQGHTALHLCIIGFTMFKDGLNKRQVNDVVEVYCRQIYPIYMACIDTLLGVDGIDVNIPDIRGRTSLMMAAMKNDRVLTRKLLQAGAIVTMLDYSGRAALQYLDIYQSVFDLSCFKLLLSNGSSGILSLPCIDGNTVIQTALCFPRFWEPCQTICFIKHLIAENCDVQSLVTSSVESNYNQIGLTELSSSDRDKLRRLLYLSGAQCEEVMTTLNFDEEDNDTIRSRGREEFVKFCGNISLKSLCRRCIRQNLGLGIQEKVGDQDLPYELNDFLLLKDVLRPQDYHSDHIDDGCIDFDDDDDYDGYDIDGRDEDYSQYKYQYFTLNTDHELRQIFLKTEIFPNDEYAANDDDHLLLYYRNKYLEYL